METAFADQPIGRPILGTPETVKASTPARSAPSGARNTTPGNMVLAAAGDVDHDALVDAAERLSAALPREPGDRRASPAAIAAASADRRASSSRPISCSACPACSFKDPRYYATQLFAHVLGGGLTSRLWHEVREKRGLAYSIDAFHWPFSDCGLFGIGAGTGAGGCRRADGGRARLRARRRREDVERGRGRPRQGADEGRAARRAREPRRRSSGSRGSSWPGAGSIPSEEIVARVDAVTVEEVRAAGRSLLGDQPTLAAIGPIQGSAAGQRLRHAARPAADGHGAVPLLVRAADPPSDPDAEPDPARAAGDGLCRLGRAAHGEPRVPDALGADLARGRPDADLASACASSAPPARSRRRSLFALHLRRAIGDAARRPDARPRAPRRRAGLHARLLDGRSAMPARAI